MRNVGFVRGQVEAGNSQSQTAEQKRVRARMRRPSPTFPRRRPVFAGPHQETVVMLSCVLAPARSGRDGALGRRRLGWRGDNRTYSRATRESPNDPRFRLFSSSRTAPPPALAPFHFDPATERGGHCTIPRSDGLAPHLSRPRGRFLSRQARRGRRGPHRVSRSTTRRAARRCSPARRGPAPGRFARRPRAMPRAPAGRACRRGSAASS